MGQAGVYDRKQLTLITKKNNLKGRRWEQQGVLLGEAFPPAYSAGSGSSSPKEMISRVDDSGTTRAPLPFFRTFG